MIVNILGKGTGWKEIENAPEGFIYGCNDAFLRTPEVTHAFHMHNMDDFGKAEKTASSTRLCKTYANEMRPDMRFITLEHWSEIPSSEAYPLDEIIEKFGVCYFTSTIDYMIAYALNEGAKEINLYGINMSVKSEYAYEKPGAEFWIGMAMGMGVKVNLQTEHTSLMKSRDGLLYGYLTPQFKV